MKISQETLHVLKTFSRIENSIRIEAGDTLDTAMSNGGSIQAMATVPDVFPSSFGIFNLQRFIATLSLFDEPEIDIDHLRLTIHDDKKVVKYTCANPDIVFKPKKRPVLRETADFDLPLDAFKNLRTALTVLGLPEVGIEGVDGGIFMTILDRKTPTADSYRVKVGENAGRDFSAVLSKESVLLLPADGDYQIRHDYRGMTQFSGGSLVFWIANIEAH